MRIIPLLAFNLVLFGIISLLLFKIYRIESFEQESLLAALLGCVTGSLSSKFKIQRSFIWIFILFILFSAVFSYNRFLTRNYLDGILAYVALTILFIIFSITFYSLSISELFIANHAINKKSPFTKSKINMNEILENNSDRNPIKIFISYSHKDEKWKNKLQSHLSTLRNQGFLLDWDDREIEAGFWDTQIQTAMEAADIFLLLVTHNFISSAYITSREITTAYSRYKAGKAKIFPIICDSCLWQLLPITKEEREWNPAEKKEMYVWLGKFQPFPRDGKPIKNWSNQQDAFLDIANQLRKYL